MCDRVHVARAAVPCLLPSTQQPAPRPAAFLPSDKTLYIKIAALQKPIERLSSSYSRNWMPRLGTERMSVG